ncbi:MAG: radical SAM protein [Rhodospirillales bacterium]|nr:radical SAM protein [Rhodospirillales bacterium]
MPDPILQAPVALDPGKFINPNVTAKGEQRAVVALTHLKTLWFNTGSLCNIACQNCYMESTPSNDSLAYLSLKDVENYLREIATEKLPVEEIAFTGGEPFMNKALIGMLEMSLKQGYRVLVLSNAMKPMHHRFDELLALKASYGDKLTIRVSIDHYSQARHEAIRGEGTWTPMLKGLRWLAENGFRLTVAGRTCWSESDQVSRTCYATLFEAENIPVVAADPAALVLFPEMDNTLDVPEITTHCWDILGVAPETMMCASSRMVIKRKGSARALVVPCTLLPYDSEFELGEDLGGSSKTVQLNHPHCARFCVLGGASCSA